MEMKKIILTSMLMVSSLAFAHDEGHGPKLSDAGKYGGLVSGVVLKSEAQKGSSAALIFKAELVRSTDGTVRIYLYDEKMAPLDLKEFGSKGSASLGAKVKGKYTEKTFVLEKKENAFIGQMPKPQAKPYNIDVTFKKGSSELLTAFDNLD
jgi:hypothetical protein